MRLCRLTWLVFVCCCICSSAHAQARVSASEPQLVLIDGSNTDKLITAQARVFEDRPGTLEFAHMRTLVDGWHPGPPDALAFGFTKSVWWVRWKLENATDKSSNIIIDLGTSLQDYADWYVLRRNGSTLDVHRSGDRLLFEQRPLPVRGLALPLTLEPREKLELYLRLQSYNGVFEGMPVRMLSRAAYIESHEQEGLILSLYHGGLLALALYNLLVFIATRERAYGVYVLYLAFFILWSFTVQGYSYQYLWPHAIDFNNDIRPMAATWSFAALGWFAIVYLRMHESVPRWVLRLNQTLAMTKFLTGVTGFWGHHAWVIAMGRVVALALSAAILLTAIWLVYRGSRQARFFLAAFAVIGIGATGYILQISALMPTNWFTRWGLLIGSAIEMLLLAFGLADAMNTLRAEKLEAERSAREAQQTVNARLEVQVNERTQALALANRRLQTIAITDVLTNAFNRRHFNEFCSAALANRLRGEALAFCMFDIDHFKKYNDQYGHHAGDEALRQISGAVQNQLRRSDDLLFRLGGEEFGVLFAATTPDAAKDFVQSLRRAVEALNITHAGSDSGLMTASFGVAWWAPGVACQLTSQQMYAFTDTILYESKAAGRNRVSLQALYATGMHPAFKLAH